ncbi:MAG: hypothetical protein AAFO94_04240 [Bacteroidota bacterium]
MKNQSSRTTAWALLSGSLLMFVTMILHPAGGGGIEGIIRSATFAMVAHGLAIFSLPFAALGFYGLAQELDQSPLLSRLALSMMLFGLIAAMAAAALNGLAQPMFALRYEGVDEATLAAIRPIFYYNMALNHAFDYVLIAAMFLSTFLWSLAMLRTRVLPVWLGYLGIGLFVAGLIAVVSGFYFLDLHGFRIFIFGWVFWIVATGISLWRRKEG